MLDHDLDIQELFAHSSSIFLNAMFDRAFEHTDCNWQMLIMILRP